MQTYIDSLTAYHLRRKWWNQYAWVWEDGHSFSCWQNKRLLYRLQLVFLLQSTSNAGCKTELRQGLLSFFEAFTGHKAAKGLFFSLKPANDFYKGWTHNQSPLHGGVKSPQWMWLISCVCVCLCRREERKQHFTSGFQVKWSFDFDGANIYSPGLYDSLLLPRLVIRLKIRYGGEMWMHLKEFLHGVWWKEGDCRSLGLFRSENKIIKMQISRPALSKLTDWTVFLTYLIDVAYFPLFKHVGRKRLNFLEICVHALFFSIWVLWISALFLFTWDNICAHMI